MVVYTDIPFPYFWSVTRFTGEIFSSVNMNIVRYIRSDTCAVFDVF